jgi:hypothetical protein
MKHHGGRELAYMRYRFVPDPDGDPRRYRLQPVNADQGGETPPAQWEPQEFARLRFLKWRIESGRLVTIAPLDRHAPPANQ